VTPLAASAVTDLILACETFFLTGMLAGQPKARWSAAWFWQAALAMLALAALLGGIDHGFFEPSGQTPARQVVQRGTWMVIGLLTGFVFLTAGRQFFRPAVRRVVYLLAGVQFAVYVALILYAGSFLVVILNYAPVMLLMLVLSVAGLASGQGSWPMIVGLLIVFAASAVLSLRIKGPDPLDWNSLYHLGLMPGVVFLYLGGRRLEGIAGTDSRMRP
jgi:hypothetical protein